MYWLNCYLGPAVCSKESQAGLQLCSGQEEKSEDSRGHCGPSDHPGTNHSGEHGGEARGAKADNDIKIYK